MHVENDDDINYNVSKREMSEKWFPDTFWYKRNQYKTFCDQVFVSNLVIKWNQHKNIKKKLTNKNL